MVSIGERLREERSRLGRNQADFAAVAGVTKKTQMLYEGGERSPKADYLAAIAAAGVDVLYVLTGQRATSEASLAADEAALLDNYRNTAPEKRHTIAEVSRVYAASSSDEKEGEAGAN